MHKLTHDQTENSAMNLADAVLRVWARNLDLAATVTAGYREIIEIENPGSDPNKSAVNFQINLDDARRGIATPKTDRAKQNLVRALLRVWFNVQHHLRNQIFIAVRELAIKRGKDPDTALMSANQLLTNARHVEEVFAEKRDVTLSEQKRREKAHAKRALDHLRRGLEREQMRASAH